MSIYRCFVLTIPESCEVPMHQNKTSSKRFSYVLFSHPSVICNDIGVRIGDKYKIKFP